MSLLSLLSIIQKVSLRWPDHRRVVDGVGLLLTGVTTEGGEAGIQSSLLFQVKALVRSGTRWTIVIVYKNRAVNLNQRSQVSLRWITQLLFTTSALKT